MNDIKKFLEHSIVLTGNKITLQKEKLDLYKNMLKALNDGLLSPRDIGHSLKLDRLSSRDYRVYSLQVEGTNTK